MAASTSNQTASGGSSNSEVKVPVLKRETSVLENEHSSIRERFDEEMHRMESEMNRLRSDILEGNRRLETVFKDSRLTTTRAASSRTSTSGQSADSNQYRSELQQWIDNLDSPLIQDQEEGSGRVLKLRFDVSEYKPEEIVVKTIDNKLKVHAKHEEKTENKSVYREYNREFLLPKGTNPEMIKSTLSRDGVLSVESPLPALPTTEEHKVPIQYH